MRHSTDCIVIVFAIPQMQSQAQQSMGEWNIPGIITEYGMETKDTRIVEEWCELCDVSRYYAQAYCIQGERDGQQGIFIVCSTPLSTWQYKQNHRNDELHERIVDPDYYYFDTWWYPGKCPGNWKGCTWGGIYLGPFEDFLNDLCMKANIPDWRQRYAPRAGEWHNQQLYRLVNILGIPWVIKITAGLCMSEFRCLDVYERIQTGNGYVPDYEAWFIVGMEVLPPRARRIPEQHEWWHFPVRFSRGQKSLVAEWHLNKPSKLRILCDRYAEDPNAIIHELVLHCEKDPDGLYRVLGSMMLSPSMAMHDPRMEPLKRAVMTLDVFRGVPRAIEDKKAEQSTRPSSL